MASAPGATPASPCSFPPPRDCGGHGTLQGCTCNCNAGYANDFTVRGFEEARPKQLHHRAASAPDCACWACCTHPQNLQSIQWCVATASSPTNSTTGGRDTDLSDGIVYNSTTPGSPSGARLAACASSLHTTAHTLVQKEHRDAGISNRAHRVSPCTQVLIVCACCWRACDRVRRCQLLHQPRRRSYIRSHWPPALQPSPLVLQQQTRPQRQNRRQLLRQGLRLLLCSRLLELTRVRPLL